MNGTGRLARAGLCVTVVAVVGVMSAGPAFAHVTLTPPTATIRSFATYTLTVPNERDRGNTVGVDVTLPSGFTLEEAQSVPGWRTVVDTRSDGVAVAVHWRDGSIPPKTFAEFAIRGRTGAKVGPMEFPSVQLYDDGTTETWIGPAGSEQPAPVLDVRSGQTGATPTGDPSATTAPGESLVPLAPSAADTRRASAATDSLSRSRSALALALSVAALLLSLAFVGSSHMRLRAASRAEGTDPHEDPGARTPRVPPIKEQPPPADTRRSAGQKRRRV